VIASLAMYAFPDCIDATNRFWEACRDHLRAAGIAAPDTLEQGAAAYWPAWESPDLVLSQTCGYPFRAHLHAKVTLIGTPDYGVEGCAPGHYRSLLIVRADAPWTDPAAMHDARFAYNDALSQSGWAAPASHARKLGLRLVPTLCTGSHLESARAVAEGLADLAALDAVTWRLLQRNDPALGAGLRVVAVTEPTPGLPYIAALGADSAATFDAVRAAIGDLAAGDRATLGIRDLIAIPVAAYLAVDTPPPPDHPAQAG
jgi:ABC-type phosphate/phosphonate transport system substrate-binding protein